MPKVKITIDPVLLRKAEERIAKKMQERLEAAGQELLREGQARVPVLTGALRRSLRLQIVQRRQGHIGVAVGSPLLYARMVELGTDKMRARVYLRRGLFEGLWRKLIGDK